MRREAVVLCLVLAACGGADEGGGDDDGAGAVCGGEPEHSGEATYYDADGSGNCSFEAGGDLMVAAMNTEDYDGAAACGACITADGPRGSVTVRIVDRCPGCAEGDVDFSEQAFARIADVSAGRVPVSWRYVPCDVDGAMSYHFKDGSSQFWVAIQVRNHRHAIATLEAQQNGAWRELRRESYNYFIADGGLGAGPFALRITDVYGGVVEDDGIALGDDVERDGDAQLPICSASAQ